MNFGTTIVLLTSLLLVTKVPALEYSGYLGGESRWFVESPAYPLEISNDSIDFVICQQGFQFFPNKLAAVQEIYRVLRDGGQTVVTTWGPVEECQFFGAICKVLDMIGETEISDMMRIPFALIPALELTEHFKAAGFANVRLRRQDQDLIIDGGIPDAIQVAYSTPIGPKLRDMSNENQSQFRNIFTKILNELSADGITMGQMVSNVISAEKLT
jgi:SAM-dependent methyltransferase